MDPSLGIIPVVDFAMQEPDPRTVPRRLNLVFHRAPHEQFVATASHKRRRAERKAKLGEDYSGPDASPRTEERNS